jgi:hypothetical protein
MTKNDKKGTPQYKWLFKPFFNYNLTRVSNPR